MEQETIDTREKALKVNLDSLKYGTFAEIGAGQEVVRWFFRVGGAAGTIAKSMSAYDMTFSDAIYGESQRYVSRERLEKMLDREYSLLVERLSEKRGSETQFFVFADTVKARSYMRKDESHGWLGVKYQSAPNAEPSTVILHVRMLDNENIQQQEALGTLGVNLVYGSLYLHSNAEQLIKSLLDQLNNQRIEIDLLELSGPDFEGRDNRLTALQLVELGLTDAAMFTSNGEVVQPAEVLYKKNILVERGSFRPVTNVTVDMLKAARTQFIQEPGVDPDNVVVLMEMTLNHLIDQGEIDRKDFLDRADILNALGQNVLISNYGAYHRLAAYLFRQTKNMSAIVMGVPSLKAIFEPKFYKDLEGGILESFGRLFKNDLKLYVYPMLGSLSGTMITAGNLRVAPNLRHLYFYLLENQFIHGLRGVDESLLSIFSRDALKCLREGGSEWEDMVPEAVAALIKERKLLGYGSATQAEPVEAAKEVPQTA